MDGKSINWSLNKRLELTKAIKENSASLFDWVFSVGFNSNALFTVNFPNRSDTVS